MIFGMTPFTFVHVILLALFVVFAIAATIGFRAAPVRVA